MEANVRHLLDTLYDEFAERDFSGAIDTIWSIGTACNLRMPLTVLQVGVSQDFAVWSEPTFQLNLISTISHLRLGEIRDAEYPYVQAVMAGGSLRQHLIECLALALDRAPSDRLLADRGVPSDDSLRLHYYAAEGGLTGRDWPKAKALFARCLASNSSGPESRFARARLAWLAEATLL